LSSCLPNSKCFFARAVGISGTPSYVIGKDLVVGAVGIAALKDRIEAARGPTANQRTIPKTKRRRPAAAPLSLSARRLTCLTASFSAPLHCLSSLWDKAS